MKVVFIISILILFSKFGFSQAQVEMDMDNAVQNAKKGVYWALSNIPVKKAKIEKSNKIDFKLNSLFDIISILDEKNA